MFMTPVTVPLDPPATSMGTAQAGPSTISRKKFDAARQKMAVIASPVSAAGHQERGRAQQSRRRHDPPRES